MFRFDFKLARIGGPRPCKELGITDRVGALAYWVARITVTAGLVPEPAPPGFTADCVGTRPAPPYNCGRLVA